MPVIPITKQEALRIIEPVNNAPSGMDGPAMRKAIGQIEAMVGPQYAPRALQFMLNQGKADNDTAKMLSALLIKAQKGQPVTQTDIENLNGVTAGVALRNSTFMAGNPEPTSDAPSAAPTAQQGPSSASATPSTAPAPTSPAESPRAGASRIVPPDAAIAALVRNPSKAADFDAMFGPGSAQKVLGKWHKMTGAPPNG